MTDKEKRYWAYFLNVNGKIEYYEQCKKCIHTCKQSFRIKGLSCSRFYSKDKLNSFVTKNV